MPSSSPPTPAPPQSAGAVPDTSALRTRPLLNTIAAQKNEVGDAVRRPSVQFLTHSTAGLPTGSPKATRPGGRRMSSPPPPPVFRPRVSFDTFDRPADFIEENSFTLIAKHKDYEYTKRSRTFLCGIDSNDYSEYALEWLIDELVDDGDEIVCLRVVEKDANIAADGAIEAGRYRGEAEEMMQRIQAKNHESKAVNLVLEFSVGKVNRVIDEMINLYEPAILVVGTRGRSLGGFQGLLPGSVSKYCLQHSPVPVIVVRPNSKRAKAKRKRNVDPSRHGYRDLLDKVGPDGGHVLDFDHGSHLFDDSQPASDDEAAAVAAAVGYKPTIDQHPLAQVHTSPGSAQPPPPDPESIPAEVPIMKSPELGTLDSPSISSESSDSDEEGGIRTDAGGIPGEQSEQLTVAEGNVK